MLKVKRSFLPAFLSLALTAAWMFVAIYPSASVFKAAFSVLYLLFTPGYFLYRLITRYRKSEAWKVMAYALGLSLITLMLTGLATNEVLFLLGITHPLATLPIAIAVGGTTSLLTIANAIRKPLITKRKKPLKNRLLTILKASPLYILGALLPLFAIGGAITLNNGGSNWLALTAMGLLGLYFLILAWKDTTKKSLYPYALYVMTLTLLLGTSLRGWNITGHDIMQEFQVFQLTAQHAAWHMQYYQDAYMACLSITILPTLFRNLTGISDAYIFKLVFQLFFAFLAPIMYVTLRRYVAPRIALFAAFVFITFPTFLTDITMLNRQETAFICLALSLLAGLDQSLKRWQRSALVFIFLAGVVFSHYSTSYIALGVLIIAMMLNLATKLMLKVLAKRKPSVRKEYNLKIYTWPVVAGSILIVIAWNVVATQTAGNFSRTLSGLGTGIPQLVKGNSTTSAPKTAPNTSPLVQYVNSVTAARTFPAKDYFPTSITQAPLTQKTEFIAPENKLLASHNFPSSAIHNLIDLIRQSYALLIEGFVVLGAILMLILRKRYTRLPRQYVALGLASLCMVGLQVVIPSSLINYGLLRAIQQSLLFLALPMVVVAFWLMQKLRIPERWVPRTVALILTGFFLVLSGFLPTLTGSFKPALALSNNGFYYEAYYTHQDALSADYWLATQAPVGARVFSDEFTRRQLIAYDGIFARPTLVPSTIPIDSYDYLGYANTTFNDVPVYYNGKLVFYKVPYDFFNNNKNLLYNSSQVIIYK